MNKHAAAVTLYKPAFVDHFQSAMYRLVAYRVNADGSLVAIFGDGNERASIYPNAAALLEAGRRDYLERVAPVADPAAYLAAAIGAPAGDRS